MQSYYRFIHRMTIKYSRWCLMQIPVLVYFAFTVYMVCIFDSHIFAMCLAVLQLGMYVLVPLPHRNDQSDIACCLLTIVLLSQLIHLIYGIIITLHDLTLILEHKRQTDDKIKLGHVLYGICYYAWVICVLNLCYVHDTPSQSLLTKLHTLRCCARPHAKKIPRRSQNDVIPANNPIMKV